MRPVTVSMRELRAAPAKILRRALRTGAPIHVGDFVIEVKSSAPLKGTIFGAMRTKEDPGCPEDWLSAEDAPSSGSSLPG